MTVEVRNRRTLALLPTPGRVRVGIAMAALDRLVDVTVQPAVAAQGVLDAAVRCGEPVLDVAAETHRRIEEAAERVGTPVPEHGHRRVIPDLTAALGGVAFPLLAPVYDLGGDPLREVPRWAAPVLAAATVGDGARVGFGTAATRPVRRALVEALRPLADGCVDLTGLALGILAAPVAPPDRVARILAADRVAQPVDGLPDPTELAQATSVVATWGARRCERILVEAAGRPDGMAKLMATVRYARDLAAHGPRSLPNRLDALHDAYRCLIRTAPPEEPRVVLRSPAPRPRPRPRRRAVPERGALLPMVHRELAAPASPAVAPGTRLPVSPRLAALEGATRGELMFLVPRAAADLSRWGIELANCLGDFGGAVASGRSTIVGVAVAGRLAYAVEIDGGATIRQLTGAANRPVPMGHRAVIVSMLAEGGLIDRTAADNTRWLAEVRC